MSATAVNKMSRKERRRAEAASWAGPVRHYDILKEATVGLILISILTVLASFAFGSPDRPPVTISAWSSAQPVGFTDVALSELAQTSDSATYGPPYNNGSGAVQNIGPVSPQRLLGVHYPLNTAKDFVLRPLHSLPPNPALASALSRFEYALPSQDLAWVHSYEHSLAHLSLNDNVLPAGTASAGPVPEMMKALLGMAQSGGLDTALLANSSFYTTNYTKPLLFIGDSWNAQATASFWGQAVNAEHLQGTQWGVMNETGSWPGQPWLWLYTMWYQIKPFSTSANGDLDVIAIMTGLSLALLFLPFIPGLRSIPRLIPFYRLIWKKWYREHPQT